MGARPALAQIRQRILRVPKTPKIPGAAVTAAATVRHAVVHAAQATKIPGAVVTAAATVRHAVVHAAQATKIPAALAAAAATLQQTLTRTAQSPAFGVVMIACLVFGGVVGAAAPPFPIQKSTLRDAAITPVAAVTPASTDPTGPLVIIVQHPKTGFHVAAATVSAPPPTVVVNSPGALGIPMMALSAYRNAEQMMAGADPGCGVSWNLLAGIGRIESGHANGGATDARGTAVRPIYGPTLDGTLPGNEVIVQSGAAGRISYARAMGPMQFLPGTWARYASDGDGDGVADPQNVYDSTLAAARYLCSGGLNLRDQSQVLAADPALQQLDAIRPERAGLGRGVRHRRSPGRPTAAHRTPTAAGRHAPGEPRGARAEPAAQRPRPAVHRPAGADAVDRPQRERE